MSLLKNSGRSLHCLDSRLRAWRLQAVALSYSLKDGILLVVRRNTAYAVRPIFFLEGVDKIMRCRRALSLAMVGLLALSSIARSDENPKELLERAYKAEGGYELMAKFKATQSKGKGIIYFPIAEVSFTSESAAQFPDKYKVSLHLEINGAKITRVQTLIGDKVMTLLNGQQEEIDDKTSKEIKEQVYVERVTSLLPLREPGFTLTSLGESKVDGKPALGLKVASKGHREVSLYFDKETALVVKVESKVYDPLAMKEVVQEQFYRDYVTQDGLKYPTKSLVTQDGKKFMVLEVTENKNLEKLDDSVFKP